MTAVDEKNIIVVKELADKDGSRELEKMAKEMMEILRAESEDDKIHIAYGTVVNDIKEVPSPTKKQNWRWMSARSSLMRKTL